MPVLKFINGDEHNCIRIQLIGDYIHASFDAVTGTMQIKTHVRNVLWWET